MILNFIDGQYREGGGRIFNDIDPVDGSLITHVSEASREDVDDAVCAARAALAGPWGSRTAPCSISGIKPLVDGTTTPSAISP